MCKNMKYLCIYLPFPHQVAVVVVGAEMEGEEKGRLEYLVHRGFWAGELG